MTVTISSKYAEIQSDFENMKRSHPSEPTIGEIDKLEKKVVEIVQMCLSEATQQKSCISDLKNQMKQMEKDNDEFRAQYKRNEERMNTRISAQDEENLLIQKTMRQFRKESDKMNEELQELQEQKRRTERENQRLMER